MPFLERSGCGCFRWGGKEKAWPAVSPPLPLGSLLLSKLTPCFPATSSDLCDLALLKPLWQLFTHMEYGLFEDVTQPGILLPLHRALTELFFVTENRAQVKTCPPLALQSGQEGSCLCMLLPVSTHGGTRVTLQPPSPGCPGRTRGRPRPTSSIPPNTYPYSQSWEEKNLRSA